MPEAVAGDQISKGGGGVTYFWCNMEWNSTQRENFYIRGRVKISRRRLYLQSGLSRLNTAREWSTRFFREGPTKV